MLKILIPIILLLSSSLYASGEVNVYSHRHYDTDKKIFKLFEEETGIKVNVVKAMADELIKRMETEGDKSPADVLITVDAAGLYKAKTKGLLQAIKSDYLEKNIPENRIAIQLISDFESKYGASSKYFKQGTSFLMVYDF